MIYVIEIMDPSGKVTRGSSGYKTRKEATVGVLEHFKGQQWMIALTGSALLKGFEYELLTGIGQARPSHTNWFIRVVDA